MERNVPNGISFFVIFTITVRTALPSLRNFPCELRCDTSKKPLARRTFNTRCKAIGLGIRSLGPNEIWSLYTLRTRTRRVFKIQFQRFVEGCKRLFARITETRNTGIQIPGNILLPFFPYHVIELHFLRHIISIRASKRRVNARIPPRAFHESRSRGLRLDT